MSREIKFRAWEKKSEEMIPVYSVSFDRKAINLSEDWQSFHEIELMQFTGIKDKNGKDIYEGDIVKCHQDKIWKVQYNEFCCFMLYPMNNKNSMAIYPNMELVQVGNVYENKELLEEVE